MSLERSASKRPRWTVNAEACTFCRKRKSRCRVTSSSGACERCLECDQRCSLRIEDVEGDGPLLERGNAASLAGGASRGQESTDRAVDSRRLLTRIDKRTDELLAIVRAQDSRHHAADHTSHQSLGHEFSGTREDGLGDDDDIEEGIQEVLSRRIGTSLLYVTGINLHDRTTFVDPIGAGLISESGMQSVMERFHDCIENICPVKELLGSLVDQKHPFLRSCILPYLSFMRSNDDGNLQGHLKAQSILKGNLDRLTSSNPALPIMLGLVVLSLTPTNGFEQRYARQVDGFGHVGKAVDMALADGLDDNAVVGLRQPASDLATQPWLYQVKAKLMLWYTVAHRATWVEILTSPSLSARPFHTPAFSSIFPSKPQGSPLLLHLHHESRLLTLLSTFSSSFRKARQTTGYDSYQLQALKIDLNEYKMATRTWQCEVEADNMPSGPFLVFNSLLVESLIYLKITTDCVTRAPSPLSPDDRITFFLDSLKDLRARSVDCIKHATAASMDLGKLPAFHLTLAFLPYKVLRAASRIDSVDSGKMYSTEVVARYRGMLCSSHQLGSSMVAHIDKHIPSSSWGQFRDTMEQRHTDGDQHFGSEEFAELFRSMLEDDALLQFQYPP